MKTYVIEVLHWCAFNEYPHYIRGGGGGGGAKVLYILQHQGSHLILACIVILVAGKGRGGMFFFLLFLHFHSCSSFFPVLSLSSPLLSLLSILPFFGRWHRMIHKGWGVVKPQLKKQNNLVSTHLELFAVLWYEIAYYSFSFAHLRIFLALLLYKYHQQIPLFKYNSKKNVCVICFVSRHFCSLKQINMEQLTSSQLK